MERGREDCKRQHDITSGGACHPKTKMAAPFPETSNFLSSHSGPVNVERARSDKEGAIIMRLDTIIMPPYAAVILDNAMGVVHFGEWEGEEGGGQQRRTVGGHGTNLFLCGQLLPMRGEGRACVRALLHIEPSEFK